MCVNGAHNTTEPLRILKSDRVTWRDKYIWTLRTEHMSDCVYVCVCVKRDTLRKDVCGGKKGECVCETPIEAHVKVPELVYITHSSNSMCA